MNRLMSAAWLSSIALVPTPAAALDCSSPTSLACGVTSNGVTIGAGAVPADPTWCSGGFSSSAFAHIFELTVAAGTDITVTATNPAIQLFLLTACDQDACHPGAIGQGTQSVSACVEAGSHIIAATTLTDAIFTYTVSSACLPCDPVPTEQRSWSAIKARYAS